MLTAKYVSSVCTSFGAGYYYNAQSANDLSIIIGVVITKIFLFPLSPNLEIILILMVSYFHSQQRLSTQYGLSEGQALHEASPVS